MKPNSLKVDKPGELLIAGRTVLWMRFHSQKFQNIRGAIFYIMRRVKSKVSLSEARSRLEHYRDEHCVGPYQAKLLARVLWPDAEWAAEQGAGAAASRVLKRLGCERTLLSNRWGWMLYLRH